MITKDKIRRDISTYFRITAYFDSCREPYYGFKYYYRKELIECKIAKTLTVKTKNNLRSKITKNILISIYDREQTNKFKTIKLKEFIIYYNPCINTDKIAYTLLNAEVDKEREMLTDLGVEIIPRD